MPFQTEEILISSMEEAARARRDLLDTFLRYGIVQEIENEDISGLIERYRLASEEIGDIFENLNSSFYQLIPQ